LQITQREEFAKITAGCLIKVTHFRTTKGNCK
jgi:hypothetical protein